ncbi:unnamed protein product [Urochloa humidicola]
MAAYQRAPLLLLLAAARLCFMSPHTTDAVSFSYDFSKASDQNDLWYDPNGNSSAAGDGISITKMNTWSTGRVAYKEAVRLWDKRTGKVASFHTTFSFAIRRSGGSQEGGDGMAFFVGPFPPNTPPDSDGAFLGLFSNSGPPQQPTVGVEFDTFFNKDLVGSIHVDPTDITTDHVGIDVGSIQSKSYTKNLANGSLSGGTMAAGITYDAGSKPMMVTLRLANGSTVSVQAEVDFKDAGLPPDAAVGFSAATGGLIESHQLLSWSFSWPGPRDTRSCWALAPP